MKRLSLHAAAASLFGASGILLLLTATTGFRSQVGYLAFQLAMLLCILGFGFALWSGRRRKDGVPRLDPKWRLALWCVALGDFGLGMMVLGDTVFGVSVLALAVILAAVASLFVVRRRKVTSLT